MRFYVPAYGESASGSDCNARLLKDPLGLCDIDSFAEQAAKMLMDEGDSETAQSFPLEFVILNDDGSEAGRRIVELDWSPTFTAHHVRKQEGGV